MAKGEGSGRGWSGLEKVLIAIVVFAIAGLTATTITVAITSSNNDNSDGNSNGNSGDDTATMDVCVTPECTTAAARIIENMDATADPCEDFFQYACGGWLQNNEIPQEDSSFGTLDGISEEVDKAVKGELASEQDSNDPSSFNWVKQMYASCLDEAAIEDAALTEYSQFLQEDGKGGWPMVQVDWEGNGLVNFDLEAVLAFNARNAMGSEILNAYVDIDKFDTSIPQILYLDQGSLLLPRSYYIAEEEHPDQIEAYKNLAVTIAGLLKEGVEVTDGAIATDVDNMFELEKAIAAITVDAPDRRNETEMYNPTTLENLQTDYPNIDWTAYINAVFADLSTEVSIGQSDIIIAVEPEYFNALNEILGEGAAAGAFDSRTMANYLFWRRIRPVLADGPAAFKTALFEYNQVMSGVTAQEQRDDFCTGRVSTKDTGFDFAVGAMYVRNNFDEASKPELEGMVEYLRSAFADIIATTTWMDESSRAAALEKVEMIESYMAYPDWLLDDAEVNDYYGGSTAITVESSHFSNVRSRMLWYADHVLVKLGMAPDKNDWYLSPHVVNAYYSPTDNSINFLAAILNIPMYQKGAPRYLNYGAIGMVMGHEITHGFDDQGRQYDGNGNVAEWWTPETVENFEVETQCYIEQYNAFCYQDIGECVNGANTQGENVADAGGVHESFLAYAKTVAAEGAEDSLPGLDQTVEQLFFLAYAQGWCTKYTDAGLTAYLATNVHSPGRDRVVGPLQNSPDFAAAYSCPAGSYMNPDVKCALW